MKIQAFCTSERLTKKKNLCKRMLNVVRDVYQLNGRVEPDKAAVFILAHNLQLVRLLHWGDVPKGQDPYTGPLSSFDRLTDYPLAFRKDLYRSAMRGIPRPTETKVMALRNALGLQQEENDPCCFRRLAMESNMITLMIRTCSPTSPYKRKLMKLFWPRPKTVPSVKPNGLTPKPEGS